MKLKQVVRAVVTTWGVAQGLAIVVFVLLILYFFLFG